MRLSDVVAASAVRDDLQYVVGKVVVMQTRGTYPEISVPKPKGKPKGGKCGKK